MANDQALVKNFQGLRILTLESRQADILNQHIIRLGGVVTSAPSMQEIPLENNADVFLFAEKLFQDQIQLVIFMTGVGTRYLFEALKKKYPVEKITQAFLKITTVARGPKSVQALREFSVPVSITVPEPNTWREIIETLDENPRSVSLQGTSVAIQEYGESNEELLDALKKRGAQVIRVPIYRWALPNDVKPLKDAIRSVVDGTIDAVFITSAQQIRNTLRIASELGLEPVFREKLKSILVASIGPTTSEALEEERIGVDFEPSHPKMGHLVNELSQSAPELIKNKKETPHLCVIDAKKSQTVSGSARTLRRQSPFIKACFQEKTPYTPIWLMRQAGRYMKEYNAIRRKVSFIELCKNKELAAEVTIFAAEKLNVDAAIIFSDILLILEPLGLGLQYSRGDGPVISGEINSLSDVEHLHEINVEESLGYVFDAIRLTRANLNPKTPLIGFSGAPFTLAAYAIEGGGSKNFLKTKQLMFNDPPAWHALMEKLSRGIIAYLSAQVTAGCDAIQIFDSWVGCLGPEEYRKFVLPHSKKIIASVSKEIPVIHFGTGTAGILNEIQEAGGHVIGVDFRTSLANAWSKLDYKCAVQGNLDPAILLTPKKTICEAVASILSQVAKRPGHIFNLGHGILPTTPVEHAQYLVELVHELTQ